MVKVIIASRKNITHVLDKRKYIICRWVPRTYEFRNVCFTFAEMSRILLQMENLCSLFIKLEKCFGENESIFQLLLRENIAAFKNILRKFPLLWRVDLRSLSQFDFKTGNFILIKLCTSAELQSWTRNKSVWGVWKDLK